MIILERRSSIRRLGALGLTLALATLACGADSDSGAPAPSPEAAAPSTSVAPPPEPSDPAVGATACPARSPRAGESPGELLGDVDGDGVVDRVYLSGGQLGVETSSGAVSEISTGSARPVKVLGVADANGDGRGEIFVVRSASVDSELISVVTIAVLAECQLAFLTNEAGDPYAFEFGESDGSGTGVGCVDADGDGRRDLVGLAIEHRAPEVRWQRTIVRIDGTRAVNGPTDTGTFVSPQDDDEIALLSKVTCGDNPLTAELGA